MKRSLLALALLLSACSDDGDDQTATTTTTTEAPPAEDAVDWRDAEPVDVDGWHVEGCEGDAPFTCVERDGEAVGVIERVEFPADSFDVMAGPLAAGDEAAALDALAETFGEDLAEDRSLGCGEGYVVEPIPTTHVELPDGEAVRYGLVGRTAEGAVSERVVQYAGIRGETLVLLVAAAYDADGCLVTEGQEFQPDVLEEFEPTFDRLVEASPLG